MKRKMTKIFLCCCLAFSVGISPLANNAVDACKIRTSLAPPSQFQKIWEDFQSLFQSDIVMIARDNGNELDAHQVLAVLRAFQRFYFQILQDQTFGPALFVGWSTISHAALSILQGVYSFYISLEFNPSIHNYLTILKKEYSLIIDHSYFLGSRVGDFSNFLKRLKQGDDSIMFPDKHARFNTFVLMGLFILGCFNPDFDKSLESFCSYLLPGDRIIASNENTESGLRLAETLTAQIRRNGFEASVHYIPGTENTFFELTVNPPLSTSS